MRFTKWIFFLFLLSSLVAANVDAWISTSSRKAKRPVAACGGVTVGGYCWYYSASGDSCDTTCTGHGGCDLNGILGYAGANGSDANCTAVLDALGAPSTAITSTVTAVGCSYSTSAGSRRRSSSSTTCAASAGNSYRACSCVN